MKHISNTLHHKIITDKRATWMNKKLILAIACINDITGLCYLQSGCEPPYTASYTDLATALKVSEYQFTVAKLSV